ncbi:MAG: hypothetical protein QOG63_1423 [Thermoleophilaceae bacterium]|nr:hypothetical protein [Thermoleophilaceae bacterium]
MKPRIVVIGAIGVLFAAPVAQAKSHPVAVRAARAHAILRHVRHVLAGRSGAANRDLTPLLVRLSAARRSLAPADRRRVDRILARPTDGGADPQGGGYTTAEAPGSPFCSAHYCVHWVATGADAPDLTDADASGVPDWVETVDGVAEHVYSAENGTLGWRAPKGDGTIGGGIDKTDVYLEQLGGGGLYGYSAPDADQPGPTVADHSLYGYLVVDDDFAHREFPGYSSPLTPLEVTVAHEYNHVLQFTYDVLEQTWMFEATAVWMEGKVYEEAHDYLQYLPGWVQLTAVPMTRFSGTNPSDRGNIKVYGSSVWNKWLDARYGPDVVRRAWEDSPSVHPLSFAPAAYDAAIRQFGGNGFSDEFARFAAATAEWQSPDSGFPEGALYPDVNREGTLAVDGGIASVKLNHTTYALINVRAGGSRAIHAAVRVPAGTRASVALVGRVGEPPDSATRVALKQLPHGGLGSVTMPRPGRFSRLTAVIVNSDASVRGFSLSTGDWVYRKDGQRVLASVSRDFAPPHAHARTPGSGQSGVPVTAQVLVGFSERVVGVRSSSFELLAPGGGRVPARVRFTPGARRATLVPRHRLRWHTRYRVRLSSAITDTALNPLAAAPSWKFTTARR